MVGYNAFDITVPVRDFPAPDQKCEVSRLITGGGGPGATAALALARLGAEVKLMTPLTDDIYGQLQRRELEDGGVDLTPSPTINGHQSPLAVILVDEERPRRTIFWTRGDVPHLSLGQVPPAVLDGIDLLYVDGHEPEVSIHLAQLAAARGLPVVMDAGSVRERSAELIACCTDVVSSRGFAPALTGRKAPLEALQALRGMGPLWVAMTFGGDGSIGLDGNRIITMPAFEVPVTDTTGAGDAFHAGYAFARARGEGLGPCLEWGSAVAGLKCGDWGGRRGLPDLTAVLDLLETGRRCSTAPLQEYLPSAGD
ncbi:MAG: PfkB family carbohydrate kinase [Candidatus Krumholzibacteriota bacterium]